jgi:hypothetical protein
VEPAGADHLSATVHASGPTDVIDLRLRLSQPEDVPIDETRLTTFELEVVQDGEVSPYPMRLDQARLLATALARLVPACSPVPAST